MAASARAITQPLREQPTPSPGLISHIGAVLVQPKLFFANLPDSRQWLVIALFVLVITGFAAANQVETQISSTSVSTTTANAAQQTSGFSLDLLQDSGTTDTSTQTGTDQTAQMPGTSTTTSSDDPSSLLMVALLSVCGVLALWAGQVMILSLVSMLRSRAPDLGRNLRIVVWSSLPLALMLVLRMIYFARGGTGGDLGLTLLLSQWDGYEALPELAQRILSVFMSNLTLFWLWNMLLLYFGARYALGGRRFPALIVIAMWIAASTIAPAYVGTPITTATPRVVATAETDTTASSEDSSTSTTTTFMQEGQFGGDFAGSPPSDGGVPPSGAPGG